MKTDVEKESPEWSRVHYRLQLILGLPAALPTKISRFNGSDKQVEELRNKYPGKTILDAHLNLSLIEEATQRKLLQKKCRMSDVPVETGHLSIQIDSKDQRKSSLWLLKACVGDSYCIHSSNQNEAPSSVPEPYDSIYLSTNESEQLYKHNYILREPDQYVLEYEVVYILEKAREFDVREVVCNKCERRSAVAYCKQEQAYFCSECNILHHRDKLLASHNREQLTRFNTTKMCKQPSHNKRLQLYCENCQKIVCTECTMTGWHSTREFSNHQVKPLKRYYQQKTIENEDTSKFRKTELSEQIKRIEGIIEQVDQHSANIEKKIIDMCESALRDLRELTKGKLDQLLVVKVQTKRHYDQLVWTDSFIKYQQQLLKPVSYIQAQKEFQDLKRTLNRIPLKPLPRVKPNDTDIEGDIRMVRLQSHDDFELQGQHFSNQRQNRDKSYSKFSQKSRVSKFSASKSNNPNSSQKPGSWRPHEDVQDEILSQHLPTTPPKTPSKKGFSAAPILEAALRNAGLTSIKCTFGFTKSTDNIICCSYSQWCSVPACISLVCRSHSCGYVGLGIPLMSTSCVGVGNGLLGVRREVNVVEVHHNVGYRGIVGQEVVPYIFISQGKRLGQGISPYEDDDSMNVTCSVKRLVCYCCS